MTRLTVVLCTVFLTAAVWAFYTERGYIAATQYACIVSATYLFSSFKAPFLFGRGAAVPHWDFGGSAVVTSNEIRLTPDRQSRRGWIWNTVPNHMRAWEIEMEFSVHGQGKHTFGDGFALWYVETPKQQGPVYGSSAVFKGLGIIFDTFDNDNDRQNPYVMIAVNDGTKEFDYAHDGRANRLDGCRADFRNAKERSRVKITYMNGKLDVLLALHGPDKWSPCASAAKVDLPVGYYFGLSAETGDVADNHDLISFTSRDLSMFASMAENQAFAQQQAMRLQAEESTSSGWLWTTMMTLVVFAVIGVVAYVAFKYVQVRKRKSSPW